MSLSNFSIYSKFFEKLLSGLLGKISRDQIKPNWLYEIRRSRSYFFELADRKSCTNEIHLKIHTK